jgi:hypothetical protein
LAFRPTPALTGTVTTGRAAMDAGGRLCQWIYSFQEGIDILETVTKLFPSVFIEQPFKL